MLDHDLCSQDRLHVPGGTHRRSLRCVRDRGLSGDLEAPVLVAVVRPMRGHGDAILAVSIDEPGIDGHAKLQGVDPARRIEGHLIVKVDCLAATDELHVIRALVLDANRAAEVACCHGRRACTLRLASQLPPEGAPGARHLHVDVVQGLGEDSGQAALREIRILVRTDHLPLVSLVRDDEDRLRLHVEVALAARLENALCLHETTWRLGRRAVLHAAGKLGPHATEAALDADVHAARDSPPQLHRLVDGTNHRTDVSVALPDTLGRLSGFPPRVRNNDADN
mmetsp:Transcript_86875/g.269001  ORF Transcript_86875/g.269001 Transcript_86875/m.269001 type:complete len:281 (+) Transcript_86875:1292-2134(+)